MTGMLASVNSLDEALLVLNTSVDIIDLKNPVQGALGALSVKTVAQIVQAVDQKKTISATVGDLPMHPEIVFNAVAEMANTQADYIKIGFFPGGDWQGCISKLNDLSRQGNRLIAVLFADTEPDFGIINDLKKAGFRGVMLDTMDKSLGSLSQLMSMDKIKVFVASANKAQLLCGLAGSLKEQDIPPLMQLKVDYLGFRGALCEKQNRTSQLSLEAILSLSCHFEKNKIHSLNNQVKENYSRII